MKQKTVLGSPLFSKLRHHVCQGEVEVDLGGGEAVMTQEALQSRQGDPFLDGGDGKGVTQDVGHDRPANVSAGRHTFDKHLDSAGSHAQCVVQRKVSLQQGLYTRREGNDAALGLTAIQARRQIR